MATEQQLAAYKKTLLSICSKSEDTFEKQLSYISAGSIGVSMLIVEHVIPKFSESNFRGVLLGGWISLALTLLLNLLSHVIAARLNYITVKEIDMEKYSSAKAEGRRLAISLINYVTVSLLAVGIGCLIFYVYKNL
jgi:hypothetical protein